MTVLLHAEDRVAVDRRTGVVVSYRMTERGQLCRVRFEPRESRPGAFQGAPEYVELLASSPRISPLADRAAEASVA